MIVAFTGTRRGLTADQVVSLHQLLDRLRPTVWLHGACVGADEDGVVAVRLRRPKGERGPGATKVIAYPGRSATGPDDHALRSRIAVEQSDEVAPVDTHFSRNRAIVNRAECVVACPGDMKELTFGGTWHTINYARKEGKPVYIVWPNGAVQEDRPRGGPCS